MTTLFNETPRLVLFEGLPGSGKSTAAQQLLLAERAAGRRRCWWYEEQIDHPLALFHDAASLHAVIADVFGGDHRRVIAVALERYERLADKVMEGERLVIDGQLVGGLGWTLHAADVDTVEIGAYLQTVAEVVANAGGVVVLLAQTDPAVALHDLLDRRGTEWSDAFVARTLGSPYASRRGLEGEAGAAETWSAYQRLAVDSLAGHAGVLIIDDADGLSPRSEAITAALQLPTQLDTAAASADLDHVGTYTAASGAATLKIGADHDHLTIDGVAGVWPHTRLLRVGSGSFVVESLPVTVTLAATGDGATIELACPALNGTTPSGVFTKADNSRSRLLDRN